MTGLRTLLRDYRRLALVFVALAFCIRALVPAGYMVSSSAGATLTILVCADSTGAVKSVEVPLSGKHDGDAGETKADGQCAFSALGKHVLGGADPILLALAFAFILILGLAPTRALPTGPTPFLLPPLRGPPATA